MREETEGDETEGKIQMGETYERRMERDRGEKIERKRQRGKTEGKGNKGGDGVEETEKRVIGGEK